MSDPIKYQAGPLTMAHVFEPSGLENLSDMQVVLDAVEVALVGKVELMEALLDVKSRIESSDEWWMDDPSRGGFDLDAIKDAIASATTPLTPSQ